MRYLDIVRDETSKQCSFACTQSRVQKSVYLYVYQLFVVELRKLLVVVCVGAHVKYDLRYTRLGVQVFICLSLIYTHSICIFFM